MFGLVSFSQYTCPPVLVVSVQPLTELHEGSYVEFKYNNSVEPPVKHATCLNEKNMKQEKTEQIFTS